MKGRKTDTFFVTSENFHLRLVIGHTVFFLPVRKIVRPIRLRVFCNGSFLIDNSFWSINLSTCIINKIIHSFKCKLRSSCGSGLRFDPR